MGALVTLTRWMPLVVASLCAWGSARGDWTDAPPVVLSEGDLVFRRGNGFWTRYFVDMSTRERRFSHVGVVAMDGDGLSIIHAEADDVTGIGAVRRDGWARFFSEARDCAVYRYDGDRETARRISEAARRRLGVPFDPAFSLEETNRLYCTELVRIAVNEGVCSNLVGTTACGKGRLVALDDIYRRGFVKIFDLKERGKGGSGSSSSPAKTVP